MINFRDAIKFDKDATLIFLEKDQVLKNTFVFQNKEIADQITGLSKSQTFTGDKDESFTIVVKGKLIILVGLGDKVRDLTALRIAARRAFLSTHLKKIKAIEVIPSQADDSVISALIEGIIIGTYSWDKYLTAKSDTIKIKDKTITIAVKSKKEFNQTITIAQNVNFSRDMINENADVTTSEYFEKTIKALTKGQKNISLEILSEKELKENGCGLHIAVNQGSNKEPKLLIAKYTGAGKNEAYTALIGKGLTFDSGGLNLKPSGHIETMRTDMSGAAAVLGVLKTAVELNIKKNLIFVCAVAENAIGPKAYKPGDVIRSYSGKTVEIGNTDAEGRLVLADAIAYTVKNYKPKEVIDIATLTGAVVVALGFDYTGLISTDEKLTDSLMKSAAATDDRVWRLPLYSEIQESMKSKIADLKNTSNIKGAGTITGAEFLRNFVGDVSWAHLDIAGTSFVEHANRLYFGHGGTGAGVRLLTHYLMNN